MNSCQRDKEWRTARKGVGERKSGPPPLAKLPLWAAALNQGEVDIQEDVTTQGEVQAQEGGGSSEKRSSGGRSGEVQIAGRSEGPLAVTLRRLRKDRKEKCLDVEEQCALEEWFYGIGGVRRESGIVFGIPAGLLAEACRNGEGTGVVSCPFTGATYIRALKPLTTAVRSRYQLGQGVKVAETDRRYLILKPGAPGKGGTTGDEIITETDLDDIVASMKLSRQEKAEVLKIGRGRLVEIVRGIWAGWSIYRIR